jgi:hypothetical protein
MKPRVLVLSALFLQVLFLVYWLFSSPGVHSELEIARDELQAGNPDLPALVFRHSDSTETTVAYDPAKSISENLVARATLRLSIAEEGYRFLVGVVFIAASLNVLLLALALLLFRRQSNNSLQATAAAQGS